MLLVLLIVAFVGYLIYDYYARQEQSFDRAAWLKAYNDPDHSPEQEFEQQLAEDMKDAGEAWKKYM